MALTDKIRAVADAIRSKTGYSSGLTLAEMPDYIQSIQTSSGESIPADIPADIVAEADRVVNGMISKMGANALTFIAISDMHEIGVNDLDMSVADNVKTFEIACRGNRNAGQAAKLISDKISLDFFANLGDIAFGSKAITTTTDGIECIVKALQYTAEVTLDNVSFMTPGNHDTLTRSQSVNGGYLHPDIVDGLIGSYCYKDFDNKKIRVICLNTADNGGSYQPVYSTDASTERISGEQLQWFAQALDLSSKPDAGEWGIVLLSHHPLDWNDVKVAANCLAAYLEGSSYSVNHNGVSVSYDFAGKNSAKVIASFHGHTHCFKVDYIHDFRSGTAVPTTVQRITIPNSYYYRNNEYGTEPSYGIVWGDKITYPKTDNGTGKNTAFCLVSIDLDNKIIYADCFGAGYDREARYGGDDEDVDKATYQVVENLEHADNSNESTTVTEGSRYTTTITANDGYELVSVTCTMGGNTVTVIDGNIDIYPVTGDIVITATTKPSTAYSVRNLVCEAEEANSVSLYNGKGYKEGVYCSSSGGDSQDSAYVSTGYIPYEWKSSNIIYIRGAKLTSDSHIRIYGYEQKGAAPSNSTSCSGPTLSTYFTVEYPEGQDEEYYKLTPTGDKLTSYIRFSLIGTGENLIITVNEPIV